MRESIKTILVLIIIVCTIVIGAMLTLPQGPGSAQDRWYFLSASMIGGLALIKFLRMHFQRDLVPDYLSKHSKKFLDRDGLCFSLTVEESRGMCVLTVYFQSRYERSSHAQISIRPKKGFLRRPKIDTVEANIACGPAAFGIARIPWAIPSKYQGKKQEFEVGATVHYPHGKGKMVRFRDGMAIRTNANFQNVAHTTLSVAGLFTGSLVLFSPASITVPLPIGVAEELPDDASLEVETLWGLDQVDEAI